MKRAQIILVAVIGFLALVALERWQPFSYLRVCNLVRDALARIGRTTPANHDLVFLAIDSASVGLEEETDLEGLYAVGRTDSDEARALKLMARQWPWSREVYGLVLNRLCEAGAKVVLFDLTFPTPNEGDDFFRKALDRYKDRVVVGSNFVDSNDGQATSHARPTETLIPQTTPTDDRVAFVNFGSDPDNVVRRAHFRVNPDNEVLLSLAARGLIKAGHASSVPSGLHDYPFRFTAPPREGFPPRSLFEIFVPEYWERNYQSGAFFRDKIVLIGGEGNWQHDELETPFGSMPGPEIHLNTINAALHQEFLRELAPWLSAVIIGFVGAIAIALTLSIRSPWFRLVGFALISGAICGAALLVFNRFSLCVPVVAPLLELNFTGLLGLIADLGHERIEKNRVRRTLEKYVSRNVVRELLDKPKSYAQSLGGVVRPASILFSDIRGYSMVSARMDPQALVTQLNEYLTAMVACVFRFGGTLDKFVGDAVMAVWGNIRSEGVRNDAANAVRSALAMRKELARLNEEWASRGLPQLAIGIGINHGDVVVGNIGSPQRMEFTVIGDSVNASWKLQELTKQLGADIVVSRNVASFVVEEFELRSLGEVNIAGLPPRLQLFEVSGEIKIRAGVAELS